jgi:glycosyltransferase involved in cell wall biosynthesis
MKNKTVAYVIFRTRENTGSKVVFNHILGLRKKGHKVILYTLFGKTAKWFPENIKAEPIFKAFFTTKPDVLVATFWPTAYATCLMRAKAKYYLIMGWEEDFYYNTILRAIVRRTYKLTHKKIVLSLYLKKRLLKYNKNAGKVYKVHTCIINKLFSLEQKKENKGGSIKILSVISWYNRAKGPDILLKAVRSLKKNHKNYEFILVSREKKPYSREIDTFYSNPSLNKLAELYRTSDILLATSRAEGFYIPGLEAMACGCIVVTTNSGGILEYCENNKNAIILEKIDQLWEKDLIYNLFKKRALANKLIRNGSKTADEYRKISWEQIIENLGKIYQLNT